jgi:hypothetical protein
MQEWDDEGNYKNGGGYYKLMKILRKMTVRIFVKFIRVE